MVTLLALTWTASKLPKASARRDAHAVDDGAGAGDLEPAGDDGFQPARARARHAVVGAEDGDRTVEDDVLVVGPGGEHDGVAGDRGVDRRLDGGVAAIADQQDVGVPGTVDLLDAGEGVGALGTARGHDEVAGAV